MFENDYLNSKQSLPKYASCHTNSVVDHTCFQGEHVTFAKGVSDVQIPYFSVWILSSAK